MTPSPHRSRHELECGLHNLRQCALELLADMRDLAKHLGDTAEVGRAERARSELEGMTSAAVEAESKEDNT